MGLGVLSSIIGRSPFSLRRVAAARDFFIAIGGSSMVRIITGAVPPPKMPEREFYQRVGQCITEWANVERQLFRLCSFALGTGPERAAIIYYRTPTLDSRLDLVAELIRTKLPRRIKADGGHDHPLVTEWTTIIKYVKALLQTRNFIAHQPHKETECWIWIDEESVEATSWVEIYRNFHERICKRTSSNCRLTSLVTKIRS
jgi:hypothetical protein